MSELEDKISEVLGDPEQMAQITRLAQSLMGGAGDAAGAATGGTESARTSATSAAMPSISLRMASAPATLSSCFCSSNFIIASYPFCFRMIRSFFVARRLPYIVIIA